MIDANIRTMSQAGSTSTKYRNYRWSKYDCYEIPIELVFKQPGRYALPKIGALCRVPNKRQHSYVGI